MNSPRPTRVATAFSVVQQTLLTSHGVVAFWIGYGVLFAATRLVLSRTLALDEARTAELAQEPALGYSIRNPPLHDQIAWVLAQVVGPGIESHLILRFALLAAIGIATFFATRRALNDERWAAAASLSMAASYPYGWLAHNWGTHTLVLSLACLWSFAAFLALAERATWVRAANLGLALGVGFLAKFSFPLFLAALVLALAFQPLLARAVLKPQLVASLAIAAACLAPFATWLVAQGADLPEMARANMVSVSGSHLQRSALGLLRLSWSLPLFLLPWVGLVVLAAWPKLRFSRASARPEAGESLATHTTLIAIALAALAIAATGATRINERYVSVLLVLAPIVLFGLLARRAAAGAPARIVTTSLCAVAVVLAYHVVQGRVLPGVTSLSLTTMEPYAALRGELVRMGYDHGTAVTTDVKVGGNLRAILPELRVVVLEDSYRAVPPPHTARTASRCFAVWLERWRFPESGPPAPMRPPAQIEALAPTENAIQIEVPWDRPWIGRRRVSTWRVLDLPASAPPCR